MASALASTFGMWLVALFLESILYGMGLLQVYLYFLWYSKDNWGIKATVITITVLETFQTITFFVLVYTFLIDDFGDFDKLAFIPWQSLAQLVALYTSTFVVQAYFAHCIYLLHKKNIILPGIIFVLSFVGLGAGIAQVVISVHLKQWIELPKTSAASNTQAALSLTSDILITVALCWRLNHVRSGVKSTEKILNFLIVTAVNRGLLTMLTALMNMVLFLSKPGTFYFQLIVLISGKFYMNSMLGTLNTRQHAHSMGAFGGTLSIPDHICMPTFPSAPSGNQQVGINISVTRETDSDGMPR
ncbi:hypothetical protein C8R44DRAFT_785820 [Mycena epipterygia]|nr:hypothetical protein C8R44DRAFT_785820 [Mycena epipterygia]